MKQYGIEEFAKRHGYTGGETGPHWLTKHRWQWELFALVDVYMLLCFVPLGIAYYSPEQMIINNSISPVYVGLNILFDFIILLDLFFRAFLFITFDNSPMTAHSPKVSFMKLGNSQIFYDKTYVGTKAFFLDIIASLPLV